MSGNGIVRVTDKTFIFYNLVSVWVNKYITKTDKNTMLLSELIDVVSDLPDVSDFIKNREVNNCQTVTKITLILVFVEFIIN